MSAPWNLNTKQTRFTTFILKRLYLSDAFFLKQKFCFVMKYVDLFKQTHGWLEKKIEIAA